MTRKQTELCFFRELETHNKTSSQESIGSTCANFVDAFLTIEHQHIRILARDPAYEILEIALLAGYRN